MAQLVHPTLSYRIVGILFDVYNSLGGGYQEKYYQRAVATAFKQAGIQCQEQVVMPLMFGDRSIGRYFLDFVVDGRIVLEIKAQPTFYKRDIKQVLAYLKSSGISLAILASFTRNGLKFHRVLKGHSR